MRLFLFPLYVTVFLFFIGRQIDSQASFPASNENRPYLFFPCIDRKGGGYTGVGTDQNFIFIARAKSKFAVLVDRDPIAVLINRIHASTINNLRTKEEYIHFWLSPPEKIYKSLQHTKLAKGTDKGIFDRAFSLLMHPNRGYPNRLKTLLKDHNISNHQYYFSDDEQYNYLRNLIQQGKVFMILGDITKDGFIKANRLAKKMAIKLPNRSDPNQFRIIYLSNVEDHTGLSPGFRKNIEFLSKTSDAVIIRTTVDPDIRDAFYLSHKYLKRDSHKIKDRFLYQIQAIDSFLKNRVTSLDKLFLNQTVLGNRLIVYGDKKNALIFCGK